MTGWIERLVLAWLRAVAPRGWTDTVVGDLREDIDARRGFARARAIAATAGVAGQFTLEAIHARRRAPRKGRRNMDILTDLRQAARSLARTPAFSLVAIFTLALAIGANTAIYSALSSLVLQPLPFKDGNRFVLLWRVNAEMGGIMMTPPREVVERWDTASHVFETVEWYHGTSRVMTGSGEAEELRMTFLNPSTLPVLGIQPVAGRSFAADDFEPTAAPVVLISHALWKSRFGGDEAISGRAITLDGTAYTIVGVMPARFALPMGSDTVWAASRRGVDDRPEHTVTALGKLADGVSVEQAKEALAALPATPEGDEGGTWEGRLMTGAEHTGTRVRSAVLVLSGAVGLLLLIACVNVANLILTRHGSRRREVAMRHALGASRARLARYLLTESALLALAGGAAGLAVAYAGLSVMSAIRPRGLDVLERIALDPAAIAFAAGVTALTAVLFGLAPAVTGSRAELADVLKAGGRAATPAGRRVRGVLTVAQIALALVLMIGAGLLLRSYASLTAVDPGFEPSGLVSVRLSLPETRYPAKEPAKRRAFFEQALASISALPGVTSVAAGSSMPFAGVAMLGTIEIEGKPADASNAHGIFVGGPVSTRYFSALGIDVLEGRAFVDDDARSAEYPSIVGRTFAAQSWPNESAIGKRFRTGPKLPWRTVIGVVEDVKTFELGSETDHAQIYQHVLDYDQAFGVIVARTTGDPDALLPAFKARIWEVDPALPLGDATTGSRLMTRAASQSRFNLALLGIFACCGLLLAVVGVYGVTALQVGERTREVGIRMALGATRAAVAKLVFRQTAVLVGVAVIAGGIGAWLLSRYLESLVFATATTDALTFAAAIAAVVIASIAATLVPMRRATNVDPATVLRAE